MIRLGRMFKTVMLRASTSTMLVLVVSAALSGCLGHTGSGPAPVEPMDVSDEVSTDIDLGEEEALPSEALLEIPRVRLPPVTPRTQDREPMPLAISLPEVGSADFRGASALFRHVSAASSARYRLEPGAALPFDVSDSLLGEPLLYPAQARNYAALVEHRGHLLIVDQVPGIEAEDLLIEAELAMRGGAHAEALERFESAVGMEPHLARAWLRRAEAELHLDDIAAARRSLEQGLALSPIDPFGQALLAELRLREGDFAGARSAASRALALYPSYPPILPLIPVIAGEPLSWSAFRPRVRISVESDREILVQADTRATDAWMAWALCQAASRHEPDRSLLPFDDGPDGLYLRRELLCAFSLADAAVAYSSSPAARRADDPEALRVARIAEAGFLAEFTLYEIIGPRLPGVLLHATPEQHARLSAYVDRFVLPAPVVRE